MEIITQDQAIRAGKSHYFTGKPCKHSHVDKRSVKTCICSSCMRMHNDANREKRNAYRRRRRKESPQSEREKMEARERARRWHHANKDRYRENNRAWAARNRDHLTEYQSKWRDANREHVNAGMRRRKKIYRQDPLWVLKSRISSLLRIALKKRGFTKSTKTASVLGCTWLEFKNHIERQFLPGMTWSNRDQWHIDHIVPLATAKTEEDVIALNHVSNLRPMWSADNMAKGATITHLI